MPSLRCLLDPDRITNCHLASPQDPAAVPASPIALQHLLKAEFSLIHAFARVDLDRHLKPDIPDRKYFTGPARQGDALDQQIGAARRPGKLLAEVGTGCV